MRHRSVNVLRGYAIPRIRTTPVVIRQHVAVHARGHVGTEPPSWIKIKNPNYSQWVGRRERFERVRERTRVRSGVEPLRAVFPPVFSPVRESII